MSLDINGKCRYCKTKPEILNSDKGIKIQCKCLCGCKYCPSISCRICLFDCTSFYFENLAWEIWETQTKMIHDIKQDRAAKRDFNRKNNLMYHINNELQNSIVYFGRIIYEKILKNINNN